MAFAGETYNPCIESSIAKGGWGNTVAWNTITAGTLSGYTKLFFKIKSSDYDYIIIVPASGTAGNAGKQYFLADGTALTDGWIQMEVDVAKDFGDLAATTQAAFYWQALPC